MNEERYYQYWRGEYRFISYEVVNWELSYIGQCWAGYVFLNNQQCDLDLKYHYVELSGNRRFVSYDISDNNVLSAVNDVVHGGVTLTEVKQEINLPEYIQCKIGWDYQHFMSGSTDKTRVIADCIRAIDALWEWNPEIKVHCSTVGGYHSLSDGIIKENGTFISNGGIQWEAEHRSKKS